MQTPVQAVERAFMILECFASNSDPLTIDDVAQRTGLPRATAYRLAHTLETDGYLLKDERSFRLGKRVLGLGFARLIRQGFAHSSQVVLDRLAAETGQTVVLGTTPQDGSTDTIVIAAVARTSSALSVVVDVGQHLEAGDTVLADAVLADTLRPEPGSQASRVIHIGTHGPEAAVQAIAIPVCGHDGQPIASLAIVMPARRMTDEDLMRTYGDTLRRIAGQLGN